MRFKRILCGVDFSRDSLEAFRVAVETARSNTGSLHIFHVIEAQPVSPAEVELRVVEEANAAMETLIESSQPSVEGLSFTTEVITGRAFVEIVKQAQEWNADLVVLGAKGITSLEEIIVGSTAEHVLKEAPCSVLIVRPDAKH